MHMSKELAGDFISLGAAVLALIAVTVPDAYLWNAVRTHTGGTAERYKKIQRVFWIGSLAVALLIFVLAMVSMRKS